MRFAYKNIFHLFIFFVCYMRKKGSNFLSKGFVKFIDEESHPIIIYLFFLVSTPSKSIPQIGHFPAWVYVFSPSHFMGH